jgi:prevent-host-death family protein
MSESTMKGAIAEAAITAAAVELGFVVLRPQVEGRRYDLIIDTGHRLLRVQCKWAARKGAVIVVYTGTSRHTPHGYVRSTYSADEIDGVGVYCQELRRCYFLPIADVAGRWVVHLRLQPAANNQEVAIKYAAQYELGAIAQLGERRRGTAEVVGSSPTSSIAGSPAIEEVRADVLRNRLGHCLDRVKAGERLMITRRGKPLARLEPIVSVADEPPRPDDAVVRPLRPAA